MRRVVLICVALFCLAVPAGANARSSSSSGIAILNTVLVDPPNVRVVYGRVLAEKHRCASRRPFKLYAVGFDNSRTLVDRGTSSKAGGWAGQAEFDGAFAVRAKVSRTRIGNVTCKGDFSQLVLP